MEEDPPQQSEEENDQSFWELYVPTGKEESLNWILRGEENGEEESSEQDTSVPEPVEGAGEDLGGNDAPPVIIMALGSRQDSDSPSELEREHKEIRDVLAPSGCEVVELPRLNVNTIRDNLLIHRNRLVLLHFAESAKSSDLFLRIYSAAIAESLGTLIRNVPSLKLVYLNNIGTKEDVDSLHEAGIPLVIQTSSELDDSSALRLARQFYDALVRGKTIQESWDEAVDLVSRLASDPFRKRKVAQEQVRLPEESLWNLYVATGQESALDWRLVEKASSKDQPKDPTTFQPNSLLLPELINELQIATLDQDIGEALDNDAKKPVDEDLKKIYLLNSFPFPISEPLEKLIRPKSEDQAYAVVGEERLNHLVQTFRLSMELCIWILIAQLWEVVKTGRKEGGISPSTSLDDLFLRRYDDLGAYEFTLFLTNLQEELASVEMPIPPSGFIFEGWPQKSPVFEASGGIVDIKQALIEKKHLQSWFFHR